MWQHATGYYIKLFDIPDYDPASKLYDEPSYHYQDDHQDYYCPCLHIYQHDPIKL